ncbi:MAG: 3-deoxy-manno-octulosonate cytidylyltransferase [Bacteroidota bacterium]
MPTLALIPARYASSRFPGKPLIDIKGKSMIQRVYEQCLQAKKVDKVGVATDDRRIFDHVSDFGGEVWMTSKTHPSGTDRIAEVAAQLPEFETVLNVQGDEPFIAPAQIDLLVTSLHQTEATIATLVCPFRAAEDLQNPNRVKVVRDRNGKALYFSRAPIPFVRDAAQNDWLQKHEFYQHIGLYAFKRETLLALRALEPHPLELAESLEQLRWLGHAWSIQTAIGQEAGLAIDRPEDLARLLAWIETNVS